MSYNKSSTLDTVLQRMVLIRLFLPLAAISIIAMGVIGYFGRQTLKNEQLVRARYTARIVDRYLDQAIRTLDAVARVAEVSLGKDLARFMRSTWKAYGYFDTLFLLDTAGNITLLAPPNIRYQGLDMSNLPTFHQTGEKNTITISRPFISLRTGNPTVYLVRPLTRGYRVVGELSLGSLQDEIIHNKDKQLMDMIFIMDQSGLLLAHPSSALVKQQTNQSYLEIFRRGLEGAATLVYEYSGSTVLGSAARVERAGWIVVNQVPISVILRPYIWVLGLTLLAFMSIWLSLVWSIHSQLQKHIVSPLTLLSQRTGVLANGNFIKGKTLASIPDAFSELTSLVNDFQHMSDALEARQFSLQKSEERYRNLFHRVPVPLWRTTPAGECLDINQACVNMLGGPDQETLLKINTNDQYVNPEDRKKWQKIAKRDGIVHDFEVQLRRHDGKIIWGRLTSRAIQNSKGDVLFYEGSVEDITDRRQAEEELLHAHENLKKTLMFRDAVLSAIPTPVFYKDREGRYLGCNLAFSEVMGVTQDQIQGKTVYELWPGDHARVYHEKDLELMSNPGLQIYEFKVRDKDGRDRPVIYSKDVFRDENDQVAGIIGAFLDITDRRQAEEEVRQLNLELEQRVSERTAQLETANRELEAFAYSVSHDLRAPLRHIDGFIKLLIKNTGNRLDQQSHQYIAIIANSARKMGNLIDDLLSFSRMGRQKMQFRKVDLDVIVRDIIRELEPDTAGRKIKWHSEGLPVVDGDTSMLRVVMMNLISNALKFTRPREEAVIEAGCESREGKTIVFVRDNGVGFNQDYADKIFDVFQRLHKEEEFEGTGVGLAMVQRIIRRHGGRVWAEGEIDRGAVFYFALPKN